MSLFEAIILGIVQGLTEFLPVSSSGHLELGSAILGIQAVDNLLFSIIVHGATALSTIVVFRGQILRLIRGAFLFRWNKETKYLAKIAFSMIPVGIAGVFFEDKIEALFGGKVILVACMLLVTGTLLLITHYVQSKEGEVTSGKAIIIGIAQAIAILPGISRSGATITSALFLGVDRKKAAEFSFLMVLPPILGAALLKVMDYVKTEPSDNAISGVVLFAGFVSAFMAGILACRWMVTLVQRGKLIYFAIYCFVIAIVALLVTFI